MYSYVYDDMKQTILTALPLLERVLNGEHPLTRTEPLKIFRYCQKVLDEIRDQYNDILDREIYWVTFEDFTHDIKLNLNEKENQL